MLFSFFCRIFKPDFFAHATQYIAQQYNTTLQGQNVVYANIHCHLTLHSILGRYTGRTDIQIRQIDTAYPFQKNMKLELVQ